jgi:HEAT repeat protein
MAPLARANAIRALGLLGDKGAVDLMKKDLFNIDVSQREFPTEALGLIGDRSACADLFKAASHEPYWKDCKAAGYADQACKNSEWEVRQLSGEWLSRLCDGSYYDKFKTMLDEEKDEKVKKMMAVDLVRLEVAKECGDKAACYVEKLKMMPKDGAPRDEVYRLARMRDKAGFELSYLRDPSTSAALLDTVQDPDLEARYAKIVALMRLLPKDGAERIEQIIKDEHGKATFIKINEDLKRLAVKMKRGY